MKRSNLNRNAEGTGFTKYRDQILLVGTERFFSNQMVRAMEYEFPDLEINQVDSVNSLLGITHVPDRPPILTIVDQDECLDLISNIDTFEKLYGARSPAIAFDNASVCRKCHVRCTEHFDNYVPINVKLDVWLAIVRLLIAGGHYVCPNYQKSKSEPVSVFANSETIKPTPPINPELEYVISGTGCEILTRREHQVLKLAAKGLQNKVIASELALSENTIKLHMHHIISKLQVSNRTQAAAIFLKQNSPDQLVP